MKNEKLHYKMYKAGKQWMFAGIATLMVSGGVLLASNSASADVTTTTTPTAQTTNNVTNNQNDSQSNQPAALNTNEVNNNQVANNNQNIANHLNNAIATNNQGQNTTPVAKNTADNAATTDDNVTKAADQTPAANQPADNQANDAQNKPVVTPQNEAVNNVAKQSAPVVVNNNVNQSAVTDNQQAAVPATDSFKQNSDVQATTQKAAVTNLASTTPQTTTPAAPVNKQAVAVTSQAVTSAPTTTNNASAIINTGKQYVGTPYVWGGTTPAGFDCSGFVQYVLAKNGINLPRVASAQYAAVQHISSDQAQAGDLVFFNNGSIYHDGIYLGNGLMLDAQNWGVINNDSLGYFPGQVLFGRVNGVVNAGSTTNNNSAATSNATPANAGNVTSGQNAAATSQPTATVDDSNYLAPANYTKLFSKNFAVTNDTSTGYKPGTPETKQDTQYKVSKDANNKSEIVTPISNAQSKTTDLASQTAAKQNSTVEQTTETASQAAAGNTASALKANSAATSASANAVGKSASTNNAINSEIAAANSTKAATTDNQTNAAGQNQAGITNKNHNNVLPQTGEQTTLLASIIGAIMLALTALFGIKRRKANK